MADGLHRNVLQRNNIAILLLASTLWSVLLGGDAYQVLGHLISPGGVDENFTSRGEYSSGIRRPRLFVLWGHLASSQTLPDFKHFHLNRKGDALDPGWSWWP